MENAWDIPENQGCVYPDAMEGCPRSQAKQVPHRRYVHDYVERIHRAGLPGNVNPDLCLTVQDTVSATVQPVIAAAGEEARPPLQAAETSPRYGSEGRHLLRPLRPRIRQSRMTFFSLSRTCGGASARGCFPSDGNSSKLHQVFCDEHLT